jgi:hypothetical protein
MPKITLADLTSEPTTVELFGHAYRVNAITRSVQKRLEKIQPLIDNLQDEDDSDKSIATLADALAELLEPEEDAPSPKKTITDAWKADKLNLGQINALFERVQEAAVARPT